MMADSTHKEPFRVLFVCTGNTCRSPIAEGILRQLVIDRGDPEVPIESLSAGTMGMVGAPVSDFSADVAADQGIDITDHVSRDASLGLLNHVDLVLAMAKEHLDYARRLGVPDDKLYMLRGFPNRDLNDSAASIPDPIARPREVYEQVFLMIDEAIRSGFPEIMRRARAKMEGQG